MIPSEALKDVDRETLIELIVKLSSELDVLKARLNKDSTNSSKPPSSDGFLRRPKPKSLRCKSNKNSGGQPGHLGSTLKQVAHPDTTVTHRVLQCSGCGLDIVGIAGSTGERRQVFDIPKPKLEVVEHVIEVKCCNHCHHITKGQFPANITSSVQYGARVQAIAIYMRYENFIPEDRLARSFADTYGVNICAATLSNSSLRLYDNLALHEQSAENFLAKGKLVHFDETGMRVQKSLSWLHSASNAQATVYKIHKKRGLDAMDTFYVHKHFSGIAVHDHWKPYFKLSAKRHALCNAHILRELVGIYEQGDIVWAKDMEQFLLKAHRYVSCYRLEGKLPDDYFKMLNTEYNAILNTANKHYNEQYLKSCKKLPGHSLFIRLSNYQTEILRFMYDFDVPFSNNQAEQDVRMCKVRQKISGCFRSTTGPDVFCRIRGFLSTARKQNLNLFDAIIDAINGYPFLLPD